MNQLSPRLLFIQKPKKKGKEKKERKKRKKGEKEKEEEEFGTVARKRRKGKSVHSVCCSRGGRRIWNCNKKMKKRECSFSFGWVAAVCYELTYPRIRSVHFHWGG